MNRPPSDEAATRCLAEASAWRVRLTERDLESSAEFESWFAADLANAEAWRRVQSPWSAMGDAATSPEVMAARRDALHRARRVGSRRWFETRRYAFAGGVLAAAAASIVAVIMLAPSVAPALDFKTDRGERRIVTLDDGSHVSLDSSSEVKVRYSRGARRLELLSGQARFDVAHDTARPFTVHAGDETVVATGTAFNVDLVGPKVTVTLIQGRVTVVSDKPRSPLRLFARPPARVQVAKTMSSVVLSPGEALVDAPSGPPRVTTVAIDRVTAWENGQLVFADEPLGAVAARVSRYTAHPVTADPNVADLRISGVFTAGESSTFVDTVTHYLPVQASDAPDGHITLKRRQ